MKDHLPKTGIVPPKHTGASSSTEAHIECSTREEAINAYLQARSRLLDINRWHIYAGSKTVFTLTEPSGLPVDHSPEMGELIKIEIPAGGTYWVMIEEYVETIDRQRDNDLFAFRVRPTQDPASDEEAPAHFFTDEATSTFLIQRAGTKITAAEKGRNEVPNLEADKFTDKVKNFVIGTAASLGFSKIQWKPLMEGILKNDQSV